MLKKMLFCCMWISVFQMQAQEVHLPNDYLIPNPEVRIPTVSFTPNMLRASASATVTVGVHVVIDETMSGSVSEGDAISLLNDVSALYAFETVSVTYDFYVSGTTTLTESGWTRSSDATVDLPNYKAWANSVGDFPGTDVVLLITNNSQWSNAVGIAYVGTACAYDQWKYGAIEWGGSSKLRAAVAAHELGHTLNAAHSSESGTIMYPSVSASSSGWTTDSEGNIIQHSSNFCSVSGAILPVELTRFNATPANGNVLLNWTTHTELNNDYFNIEHSTDGQNFTVIGQVKGSGNSQEEKNYSFTHPNAGTGTNYYRLRQFDYDGTTAETRIVAALVDTGSEEVSIFPNPATDHLFVQGAGPGASVTITDALGKVYLQTTLSSGALTIDYLSPGVYFVSVTKGRQMESFKFLKQ